MPSIFLGTKWFISKLMTKVLRDVKIKLTLFTLQKSLFNLKKEEKRNGLL